MAFQMTENVAPPAFAGPLAHNVELSDLPKDHLAALLRYPGRAGPTFDDIARIEHAQHGSPIKNAHSKKSSSSQETEGRSHGSRHSITASRTDSDDAPATPSDGSGGVLRGLRRSMTSLANGTIVSFDGILSLGSASLRDGSSEDLSNDTTNHTANTNHTLSLSANTAPRNVGKAAEANVHDVEERHPVPPYPPGSSGTSDSYNNERRYTRVDLEAAWTEGATQGKLEERRSTTSLYQRYRERTGIEQIIIAVSLLAAAVALGVLIPLTVRAHTRVAMRKWYTCAVLVIFLCTGAGMGAGGQELIRISMVMTMELVLAFFLVGNVDVFKGMTT